MTNRCVASLNVRDTYNAVYQVEDRQTAGGGSQHLI